MSCWTLNNEQQLDSCQRCNNCCTNFGVCLTIADIARIEKEKKIPATSFIDLVLDYSPRERTEPAVILNNKMYLLVLKHEPQKDKDRVCTFFNNNRCSIYENRPYLCRTYPFTLDKKGELKDVKSRACMVFWYPRGMAKENYVSDLKVYYKQIEDYKKIVEKWNIKKENHAKDLEAFLEFARKGI